MGRLSDGAESCDQYCADANEECASEGISSEGLAEDESCKDRIKHQSGLSPFSQRHPAPRGREQLTAWSVERTGSGSVVI